MDNNPWPDLSFRPEANAKRSSFPKTEKRVNKPSAPAGNSGVEKARVIGHITKNIEKGADLDVSPPTVVSEPDEKEHLSAVARIQADIDAGEKRLVLKKSSLGMEYFSD
jgi:hypothetical protein